MAAEEKQLQEIEMSEGEANLYESLLSAVSREVQQTRVCSSHARRAVLSASG